MCISLKYFILTIKTTFYSSSDIMKSVNIGNQIYISSVILLPDFTLQLPILQLQGKEG